MLPTDLVFPVFSIEILKVLGQGLMPVQLYGEIDWSDMMMVFVLLNLLLHSRVDKI